MEPSWARAHGKAEAYRSTVRPTTQPTGTGSTRTKGAITQSSAGIEPTAAGRHPAALITWPMARVQVKQLDMTRTLIASAALTILASACAGARPTPPASPDEVAKSDDKGAEERGSENEASTNAGARRLETREVGDIFVHRFTGKVLEQPLVLTEEVVDAEDQLLVVEYTLETAEKQERLRVHRDAATWEIERVARLVDGEEVAATRADFDALLARTVVAADSNAGQLAEQEQTCVVGETELDCTSRTFEVTVNGEPATLVVTSSDELPGRDVSGVLQSEAGEVLYRAELIEAQRGTHGALAKSEF